MVVVDRWFVDDGPLQALSRCVDAPALAGLSPGTLNIAEATLRGVSAEVRTWVANVGPAIATFSVLEDTPAWSTLTQLRGDGTTDANLAEHESIAWILHDPAANGCAFVAQDKRALWIALRELGRGHAAHPVDLWLWLHDADVVDTVVLAMLCEKVRRTVNESTVPERARRRFAP